MQSAEFSDGLGSAALRLFIGCSPAAGPQTFSIYQNPKTNLQSSVLLTLEWIWEKHRVSDPGWSILFNII